MSPLRTFVRSLPECDTVTRVGARVREMRRLWIAYVILSSAQRWTS